MTLPRIQKLKNNIRAWGRRYPARVSAFLFVCALLVALVALLPATYRVSGILSVVSSTDAVSPLAEDVRVKVTHLPPPEPTKAIYMTSWVAGTEKWRESLAKLIEDTELNAVVIDVKDYTGRVSFELKNPDLVALGGTENRVPDMRQFLSFLHEKGIYTIARITVFQDPFFAKKRPDLAVKKESDGTLWEDYKGLHYIDPGAVEAWDYTIAIAREAYEAGFDELNFDYVRFPSDGNMRDVHFPFSEERINADVDYGKAKVVRDFFAYLNANLAETGAVLSADLFGMTTTNADDLNIGQVLEYAAPYFDYLAPMVYPSHYPSGFIGFTNPADKPYEVVKYSMDRGVAKLSAAGVSPEKLRPWLQDFDYKAVYDAPMVRTQMQAVYDAGLTSWMLWDAANRYTKDALLAE